MCVKQQYIKQRAGWAHRQLNQDVYNNNAQQILEKRIRTTRTFQNICLIVLQSKENNSFYT